MQQDLIPGQLFQHMDGGVYRFVMRAKDTRDLGPLVIYRHEWPFDASDEGWARPAQEWVPARFKPITEAELTALKAQDRAAAQAAITRSREARKASKQ